jgi:hypothetical protein
MIKIVTNGYAGDKEMISIEITLNGKVVDARCTQLPTAKFSHIWPGIIGKMQSEMTAVFRKTVSENPTMEFQEFFFDAAHDAIPLSKRRGSESVIWSSALTYGKK